MSELKLVVCDWHTARSCTMHGSEVDRVIAALSADPTTIDELSAAFVRFMRPSHFDSGKTDCSRKTVTADTAATEQPDPRTLQLRRSLWGGLDDEPYDAGLVVIDLAAKLIVVESTYSSHAHRGSIDEYLPDNKTTRVLNYHLDRSWKFLCDANGWNYVARERRRERSQDGFDPRSVLFGEPLLDFIARSCWDNWHRREQVLSESSARWNEGSSQDANHGYPVEPIVLPTIELFRVLFREIHAAWLLGPLAELKGKCPRDFMVEQQEHISRDLDDRYFQWSVQGRCPPPLSTSAYAYRFAGFGTAANVLYYHLIRSLLAQCWENLQHEVARSGEVPDRTSFIRSEKTQLALYRDEWLEEPGNGLFGKSPHWFYERERRRLPLVVTGPDMMPDCDCPLCQMMVDTSAPMMIGLDGADLDDEFVFDFTCRTQDDWDRKQAEWRAYSDRIEAGIEVRNELGLPICRPFEPIEIFGDEEFDWNANDNAEPSEAAVTTRTSSVELCLFDVGSELVDLIVGLRGTRNEFRELRLPDIECLNRHFATLRAACGQAREPISSSLIGPVIDRFRDDLYRIADLYPDVGATCHMVLVKLDEFPEFDENG